MIVLDTFQAIGILFLCANIFFFTGYLWKRRLASTGEADFWRNACIRYKERNKDLKEENKHLKVSLNIYAEQLSVGG